MAGPQNSQRKWLPLFIIIFILLSTITPLCFAITGERGDETVIFGKVRDKDTEEPIVEAKITIKKGESTYTAYTNEEGNYEKVVEGGGEYSVLAEREGYKSEDAGVFLETGDEKRVDFDLEKKEEQHTVIFGKVRDKGTEEPIVEAEVTFRKGEHTQTTYTNAEGNYEKEFDVGGEFTIIAEKEGYNTEDAHVVVETGEEKRVDFDLEKKEEQHTVIFGKVRDKGTEEPIVEAKITIRKGEYTYITYTNEEGNYEKQVEGGGEYSILAQKEGYKSEDASVFVETGHEKRVDFDLEEEGGRGLQNVRNQDSDEPKVVYLYALIAILVGLLAFMGLVIAFPHKSQKL